MVNRYQAFLEPDYEGGENVSMQTEINGDYVHYSDYEEKAEQERIASEMYASEHKRVKGLEKCINDYLSGDYLNPRTNRPHDCAHGTAYYQECDACNTEHFEQALKET